MTLYKFMQTLCWKEKKEHLCTNTNSTSTLIWNKMSTSTGLVASDELLTLGTRKREELLKI